MKSSVTQTVISFLCFACSVANASDYWSPRTMSLGGAGHAAPLLNDALYLNPSFGAFLPSYSLSLGYQYFRVNPERGMTWNAALQDGRSELFQAGVGFTRREDGHFVHVGAAKKIIERLGIGLGGKYALASGPRRAAQDMTFSMLGSPPETGLNLSFVIDNLIQSQAAKERQLFREFIFGIKYNVMGIVQLYFDPHYTPTLSDKRFGHGLGLEFTVFKDLFLRLGQYRNASIPYTLQRASGLGAGLGWMGPRLSFDYGLGRVVRAHTGPVQSTTHSFSVTMFF